MPVRTREPDGGAGRRRLCANNPATTHANPGHRATPSRREANRSTRRSAWAHVRTLSRHGLPVMKIIDSTDESSNPPISPRHRRPTRHGHDARRHERAPHRHAASPAPEPAALAALGLPPDAAPAPPSGRLVLQPCFMSRTPLPMASLRALLMAAPPTGPSEGRVEVGCAVPDEMPEQAADLRDGERQELGQQIGRGLLPRPRSCAARPDRRGPAWPG